MHKIYNTGCLKNADVMWRKIDVLLWSSNRDMGEHVIGVEVSFAVQMEAVGSKPHGVSSHRPLSAGAVTLM
jgi:hypothetical protein